MPAGANRVVLMYSRQLRLPDDAGGCESIFQAWWMAEHAATALMKSITFAPGGLLILQKP